MINLLPKKEKKELKLHILQHCAFVIGIFLIGIILSLMLFCASAWFILYRVHAQAQTNNDLFEQAQELEKQVASLNKELSGFINKRLEYIDQLQKQRIDSWAILERLSQITPSNIRLDLLELDNDKVQISGYAKTREDVLKFQQALDQESLFIEIYSPLSNFVKQKDVDFFFSFKIKQ